MKYQRSGLLLSFSLGLGMLTAPITLAAMNQVVDGSDGLATTSVPEWDISLAKNRVDSVSYSSTVVPVPRSGAASRIEFVVPDASPLGLEFRLDGQGQATTSWLPAAPRSSARTVPDERSEVLVVHAVRGPAVDPAQLCKREPVAGGRNRTLLRRFVSGAPVTIPPPGYRNPYYSVHAIGEGEFNGQLDAGGGTWTLYESRPETSTQLSRIEPDCSVTPVAMFELPTTRYDGSNQYLVNVPNARAAYVAAPVGSGENRSTLLSAVYRFEERGARRQ